MKLRSGTLPALLACSLIVAATPASAQAADQEARSAIMALKAEIEKLRGELVVLRAQVIKQDQMFGQTTENLQIGHARTDRLALTTEQGSLMFDRGVLTINAKRIFLNGERFELVTRDSVLIKSDTISLDARVMNVKETGNVVLKGSKILGN